MITFYFLRSLYSSRAIYFPTLYHIFAELEGAVLTSNTRTRVPIGADEDVFPNYSGVGYAIFPAYKVLYIILIVLAGPCSFSHDNAWKKHNRRMYSKIRTNWGLSDWRTLDWMIHNNYSMSPSWIWSDRITNERVARVGYNHFISNKGKWNNCFSKFSNRVLSPNFISTILQSVRKENLTHYFPYDVKLGIFAHSRSFLANQKARSAIFGAEN